MKLEKKNAEGNKLLPYFIKFERELENAELICTETDKTK